MEKEMLTKTEYMFPSYESLDTFIERLIEKKTELIKSGAHTIRVNAGVEWCHGDADGIIEIIYEILETDEELQSRIQYYNKIHENKLNQYEQLKKELGL